MWKSLLENMASSSEALTLPTIQLACGFGGQKEGIGATVYYPPCIYIFFKKAGWATVLKAIFLVSNLCQESSFSLAYVSVRKTI